MKAYYEHAGITIYHGDCRQVLPSLPKCDLLLTDPPYGIGIAANPFRQKYEPSTWDDSPASEADLLLARQQATSALIWGGNYFDLPPSQGFMVWDKEQPEDFSSAMCEQAWCSEARPAKIFKFRVVSYFKEHPTEKPLPLMKWCLSLFPEAQSVLDPFLGSGTTLVAAKAMGLRGIGIEQHEPYCEIAAKRLSQEVFDFESVPA